MSGEEDANDKGKCRGPASDQEKELTIDITPKYPSRYPFVVGVSSNLSMFVMVNMAVKTPPGIPTTVFRAST